jgi:hypothetical protein
MRLVYEIGCARRFANPLRSATNARYCTSSERPLQRGTMAKRIKVRIPTHLKHPPELTLPFPLGKTLGLCLKEKVDPTALFFPGSPLHFETKRRLITIAEYLEEPWPTSERDWLRFVFAICKTFKVPGLIVRRKGGAPTKWSERKYRNLFEAVVQLRSTHSSMSEHSACVFIANHPERYPNRFPGNPNTLHREFMRAKNKFGKPRSSSRNIQKTARKASG